VRLQCLAYRDACPAGGGAEVGDRGEQGVLPEIVSLPPGDLIQQVRFGSGAQRRGCQHGELKLLLLPAAERALGQEPLP